MHKLLLMLMTVMLLLSLSVPAAAYSYDNAIRVRLAVDSTPSVTIASGRYTVYNSSSKLFTMAAGDSLTVQYSGSAYTIYYNGSTYTGSGIVKLGSADGQGHITYKDVEYRGDFSFVIYNDTHYVINTLGTEQYLYSVVMREIGGYGCSLEALKAQAVCARSLAVYWLKPDSYYDVVPTTSNQVYGGYTGERTGSYTDLVHQAVDETRYLIPYYTKSDGSKIKVQGYYSANAGGHTEDIANVWGSSAANYPYLQGIACAWDSLPFISEGGTMLFPTTYHWTRVYTMAELRQLLYDKTGTDVGTMRSIKLNPVNPVTGEETASGQPYSVVFQGSVGAVELKLEKVRTTLGVRSAHYDVIYTETTSVQAPLNTAELLTDNSFEDTIMRTGKAAVFVGFGYGHSVGLSQWSACVMAYEGYTYQQILNHFFNQNKNDGALTFAEYTW